ncbi:HipA N-terminal domain-containing protein [Haliscomenobacter sp.]|jgi:HipA-like protein|uniref:HipA N-terminal domain-containing protein n=1 Tax=Haliscomenobacter sp. TaxID=2717303 RepID=UPI003364DB22
MHEMSETIIGVVKKWLWKTEDQQEIVVPIDIEFNFTLSFRSLEIGTLRLSNGKWTFVYSDSFKAQEEIKPLPDFPKLDKVYTSEELYPFFVQRIPGLGQPKVKEILEKEHIDEHNEAQLLIRFGRFTISNPFELKVV